ncbi:hypothetical protein CRG98_031105, partial [Punica granatum]
TNERELLEELAVLSGSSSSRSRIRPRSQPTNKATTIGTPLEADVEKTEEESETQSDDWLKKLTNFAGSVANGALKWIKDNL